MKIWFKKTTKPHHKVGIENDETKEDDKNENRQKETKLQSWEY
jgi:hypothetical protein